MNNNTALDKNKDSSLPGQEMIIFNYDEQIQIAAQRVHQAAISNFANDSFIEADTSELVGKKVKCDSEAYELYNDYAFRIGFGIRKSRQALKYGSNIVRMKEYCCWKAGLKKVEGKESKCYTKIDVRTDCKEKVQFDIDENGVWTLTKHDLVHNHPFCSPKKRHRLSSHRKVIAEAITVVQELKKNGVPIAKAIKVMRKEAGGSPFVGFTDRYAYNKLAEDKRQQIDGTDSHTLVEILRKRRDNEEDFFFDFELDEENRLCGIFWRDGRMKKDYMLFGDVLIFDTTYRTNKYGMICAPFVGMNHHCQNLMFGCGFLLNERIESFVWLFGTFLSSMGGLHPVTLMTDQCAAMAAAIPQVFPEVRHRLCIWHFGENSKKNIKGLRMKEGFVDLFNTILKYCDTEAELEFYWNRLITDYGCRGNKWLDCLYDCKEKWCSAYNKDYFSGGILSSQRSETTNKSVSARLSLTSGLCDFYGSFVEVVSEWRSKERGEDFRCYAGMSEVLLSDVALLLHARQVFTIEMFMVFEQQYIKGSACHQLCVSSNGQDFIYHVWRPKVDVIRHQVEFNQEKKCVSCTCKIFTEIGILCSHCLRILDVRCFDEIPAQYIKKRWTKDIICSDEEVDVPVSSSSSGAAANTSFVWRSQMIRKFVTLVTISEPRIKTRQMCEAGFKRIREEIEAEIGPILVDGDDDADDNIKNPPKRRQKGERNVRRKSTIEKRCNMAKGRKHKAQQAAKIIKMTVQESVQGIMSELAGRGYLAHPQGGGPRLMKVTPKVQHTPVVATSQIGAHQP